MDSAQADQKTIADILFAKKLINKKQYEAIKLENLNTGKRLDLIISHHNFVSSEEIAKAKGEIYNIPYIDLNNVSISPEALNLLPEVVAQRYKCFPYGLDKEKGLIFLAMVNPLDLNAIALLKEKQREKFRWQFV